VLSVHESVAAPCESPLIRGGGDDLRATHYYQAMHARALQREQHWKAKALAYEKTIAALWTVIGGYVQEVEALKGQLAWLNKQLFGRKSEARSAHRLADVAEPAGQSSATAGLGEAGGPGPEAGRAEPETPGPRPRGQQRGSKGPQRQRRLDLPERIIEHRLSEAERTCPRCGKLRPELGLTQESQQIEWEVRLVRHRQVRHRYGPSCECGVGRGIVTAPKPAKLIRKGLFGVSFWVQVLLKKFEWAQPLHRTVGELRAHGLKVSAGTLSGGLRKLRDLLVPLAGQFVLRSREGSHWHMDETRWPMFGLPEGKSRQQWWFWVVVTPEVTAFVLEPTRSGQVPQQFFAPGTQGILNVDRYAGYRALLGADWRLQLAYCWSHQRRDFVNLGQGYPRWAKWAGQWVERIDRLFAGNGQRRQAYLEQQARSLAVLEPEVRAPGSGDEGDFGGGTGRRPVGAGAAQSFGEHAPALVRAEGLCGPCGCADGQQRCRAGQPAGGGGAQELLRQWGALEWGVGLRLFHDFSHAAAAGDLPEALLPGVFRSVRA
jgi:transposase